MNVTVTINGPDATVNISHTSTVAKVSTTLDAIALFAFNNGFYATPVGVDPSTIQFSDLTNQDKMDLIGVYVQAQLLAAAKSQYIEDAVETARVTASTDTGTIFI